MSRCGSPPSVHYGTCEGVSINADCGTDSDQSTDGDLSAEIRVLVIGMAGHGKSTVCNILLGESQFKVKAERPAAVLPSGQQGAEMKRAVRDGERITVVDTPDVTICNMEDEVSMWKAMTAPNPHVILLAVRCNERYTQKEYDVYLTIKRLWGDSLCERLVVAFTFGDKLEDPDRLDRDCKENERLKKVLKDASKRYVVFKQGDNKTTVRHVLALARSMHRGEEVSLETVSPGRSWPRCILWTLFIVSFIVCVTFLTLSFLHRSHMSFEVDFDFSLIAVCMGAVAVIILFALIIQEAVARLQYRVCCVCHRHRNAYDPV